RIYVFADAVETGSISSHVASLGEWFAHAADSPFCSYTPSRLEQNSWFDLKLICQQPHGEIDLGALPPVFMPRVGRHELIDYENVFAATPEEDIFELRQIDRAGAIIVVRPDQYVAQVLSLMAADELMTFMQRVTRQQG